MDEQTPENPQQMAAPEMVELTSLSDGQRRRVPADRAQEYIRGGVARQTTPEELLHEQRLADMQGDPLMQAANFGTTTLRELSMGYSDRALVGLGDLAGAGDEAKSFLRDLQDANKDSWTTTAGQVLGGIGQAALILGTGGAAEGAAAAGAAGARMTARGLLRGAAKEGAISAVDMASRSVNDDWLNDRELSAERALAAAGMGALLGGALHGAIGGAAMLGRAGGEAVAAGANKLFDKDKIAFEALLGGDAKAQEAFARGGFTPEELRALATDTLDTNSQGTLANLARRRDEAAARVNELSAKWDGDHLEGHPEAQLKPADVAQAFDDGLAQLRKDSPELAIKLESKLAEFRNGIVDDRAVREYATNFLKQPEFIGGGKWGEGISGKLKQRIQSLIDGGMEGVNPRQDGARVSDMLQREVLPEIEHEMEARAAAARRRAEATGEYADAADDAYLPRKLAKSMLDEPWAAGADPRLRNQLKALIYSADELGEGKSVTELLESKDVRKVLMKMDQDVTIGQTATANKYDFLDLERDAAPEALPSARFAEVLNQVREAESKHLADGAPIPMAPIPGVKRGESILDKFNTLLDDLRGMEQEKAINAGLTPEGMIARRQDIAKVLGLDELGDSHQRDAARKLLGHVDAEIERQWSRYSPQEAAAYKQAMREFELADIAHQATASRTAGLERARGAAIEGTLHQAARGVIGAAALGGGLGLGSLASGALYGVSNSPAVRDAVRNRGLGWLMRNDFVRASAGLFDGFERGAKRAGQAAVVGSRILSHSQIEERRKELDAALQPGSPAEMAARTADPGLGDHIDKIRVRNTQMLRDALPTPLNHQGIELSQGRTPVYSTGDLRKYADTERAVTAPQETLRRIASGVASRDELVALQQAHPRQFDKIREAAIARAANINKPMTDKETRIIRALLGVLPGQQQLGSWAQMVAQGAQQAQGGGAAAGPGAGPSAPAGGLLAPSTSARLEGRLGG